MLIGRPVLDAAPTAGTAPGLPGRELTRAAHTDAGTVGDRGAALRQALAARGRRRRSTRGRERRPRARSTGHRRPGGAAGPDPRHRAALRRLRREHRAAGAPADPAAGVDGRAAHRHHPDPRVRGVGRRVAGRRAHADRRARRLPRRAVGVPVGLRGQPAHPRARHRRGPAAAGVRPAAARPRAAAPGVGGQRSGQRRCRRAGSRAATPRGCGSPRPTRRRRWAASTSGPIRLRRCRCGWRSRAAPGPPCSRRSSST